MGWNSWDCYGTTVTEEEVLSNARFMATHLLSYGWDTIVVDIDWSDPTARSHGYNSAAPLVMDDFGRLQPDPERFPSATGGAGFGPLAKAVHDLGLKFGIHTMRGIPRLAVENSLPILGTDATARDVAVFDNDCEWNPDMHGLDHTHPAAQAYYDSTLELYASWGVDFIKCDDMQWPYQKADIEAYAAAIAKVSRPIVLSLSPGTDLSIARLDHLREHANMWRICNDLWDNWDDVAENFARFARWAPAAGSQGWPDGDMLPLGRIGIRAENGIPRDSLLSMDEQRALMTLWIIARSPLMIGGDLPTSRPETIALLQNADALAVLRDSRGGHEILSEGDHILWAAEGPGETRYVAAFNRGKDVMDVSIDTQNAGLPARPTGRLQELWSGERVGVRPVDKQSDEARGVAPGSSAIDLTIPAHGAKLLRYRE